MIGQKIKQTRESKGLTISAVQKETFIPAMYINAIENDQYKDQCLDVYARGHLKRYCDFLELSFEAVKELMESNGFKFSDPNLTPADSEECRNNTGDKVKKNIQIDRIQKQ